MEPEITDIVNATGRVPRSSAVPPYHLAWQTVRFLCVMDVAKSEDERQSDCHIMSIEFARFTCYVGHILSTALYSRVDGRPVGAKMGIGPRSTATRFGKEISEACKHVGLGLLILFARCGLE